MASHQVFLVHAPSSSLPTGGVTFYKQRRLIAQPPFHLYQFSIEKAEESSSKLSLP